MKYYTIDDVTQLLTQFDITRSKQMVNRWVRDSIIIAEKIDRKYMISEENLISFIEQKKPKMIQLIVQTIEISERMEHLYEKLIAIEEKILENNVYQEGLNEIKQLLSTIQESINKSNNSKKPPVKKEKVEKDQVTMDDILNNPSVGVEDKEIHLTNEVDDNEEIMERDKRKYLEDVKNDMDILVQEDKVNYPFNEYDNNQKINKTDQTDEHFPFTDDQIINAMGVIDERIFSHHEKEIFNEIKTTLIDKTSEWYFPSEKQQYKCLYANKHFASAIPFLKSTAKHISKKWNK